VALPVLLPPAVLPRRNPRLRFKKASEDPNKNKQKEKKEKWVVTSRTLGFDISLYIHTASFP
jgi:hypothetical protein